MLYGALIWILTDSRSSIQHLQDWTLVNDLVSIRIINKLKTIAKYKGVHFQGIASHRFNLMKIKGKQVWMAPSDHPGISRKSPRGVLELEGDKNDLECLGLALEDFHASPFLVLDFARVNDLMDLI
ncbi:hypothetical protein TNCV_2705291 [Trichonephila clavipes]|nr:hypothetical protein TNCV_2705291 [Trichonephila clavipes]